MLSKNFYYYVDKDGKMPAVCPRKQAANYYKPFWIRYVNDRPVEYHGPREVVAQDVSRTKVWDYEAKEFVPIEGLREV